MLFVEWLIGPDKVNTLPLETIEDFRDHGHVRLTLEQDLDGARRTLEALEEVGIHLGDITHQVLVEGVQKFDESLDHLLQSIASKREKVLATASW